MTQSRWTEHQVAVAMRILRTVIDLADLSDPETNEVMDILLPKIVQRSGLSPFIWRKVWEKMVVDEGLRPPTRH